MSDKSKTEEYFRNEETVVRRAWIESALEGVRATLGTSFNALEFGEPASLSPAESASEAALAGQSRKAAANNRPALYVAWSAGVRRSGT